MVRFRFGVLGPIECWSPGGEALRLTRQQRIVLGVLVLEADRTVSADRLVEALWGEQLPSDPAAALRNHVARLRGLLGDDAHALSTESRGYRLGATCEQVDACRFEELLAAAEKAGNEARRDLLDDALRCWRGRALGDLADLPIFEADARRLDELRDIAREQRSEALVEAGRAGAAIPDLEALLAAAPQRERARGLLMRALSFEGRHTDAVDLYDQWRRQLADRGLEPTPALRAVEAEVLRHTGAPTLAHGQWPTSLPRPASSFVGRDDAVAAVIRLLGDAHLVTLVGPGGVGKTRLAMEVAGRLVDRYPGGIWFCDLSAARESGGVVESVATAIGLEERGSDPLPVQIARQFGDRPVLLVMDCCERVLDGTSALAETLSRHTRRTDVLATSRERLAADGEHLWSVAPLRADGPSAPAVDLFFQRARAVAPRTTAGPAEREAAARICARVDGLPLAIELAAARSRGMSLLELDEGLDQRFSLLVTGSRTTPRHRSLVALIEWSYSELDPRSSAVFRHLSVFAGAFDLEAASAVVETSGIGRDQVVPALLRLVDCSLVTETQGSTGTLYSLLDTLRAFGKDRMTEAGELEALTKAHAEWMVDWATAAEIGLSGVQEEHWADRVHERFDDLRTALDWLTERGDDAACRIVSALHFFALWRGESEVFRWAERAVDATSTPESELLPAAHAAAGSGAWQRGDLVAAERAARAGLALTSGEHDPLSRRPLEVLGDVALLQGDLELAIHHYRQAHAHALDCHDVSQAVWDQGSWALAHAYGGEASQAAIVGAEALATARESKSPSALAYAHFVLGEIEGAANPRAAEENLLRARSLATSVGSRYVVGLVDLSLASLYSTGDDPARALRYYESVLESWLHSGSWTAQWVTLRSLVALLASVGASRDAAILYGAVSKPARGPEPYGPDARRLAATKASLHDALGASVFADLSELGRALSEDEVGREALRAVRSLIAEPDT